VDRWLSYRISTRRLATARPLPPRPYAYLFGLYLGDGHIANGAARSESKHERPIVLARWQRAVIAAHPRELVRGLIHSDGCRFGAHQRVGRKLYR
jgi:hypothetical protein